MCKKISITISNLLSSYLVHCKLGGALLSTGIGRCLGEVGEVDEVGMRDDDAFINV